MMTITQKDKMAVLPDHARVWIYQSNRELTDDEVASIEQSAETFLEEWNTHGTKLSAGLTVMYNRFIILAANEAVVAASGCSIDSSVRFIKSIEAQFKIDVFDRLNIAYRNLEGKVELKRMSDFEDAIQRGEITANTVVFNNLVNTWGDLKSKWEVPASESWHSRML